MSRTARSMRPLDATRLGQAASRPGIDPRSWCFLGRVIEVGYDQGLVVAVTVLEGALTGEDVVCEVGSAVATGGGVIVAAVRIGDIAAVFVPNGDANNMGVVLGFVHEPETPPPETVNDVEITAALLTSTHVIADAARAVEVEVKTLRLVAERVQFGPTPDPSQAYVRGTAFMAALDSFLGATDTMLGQEAPPAGLIGALTLLAAACTAPPLSALASGFSAASTALTPWKVAAAQLRAHLVEGDALSTHITGE